MSIHKRKNNKGFTLIELLVVMGIIAILGTVAVTAYVGSTLKAARTEAYGNLQALRMHEAQFISENSIYTANLGSFPSFNPGPGAQYVYALNAGLVALPAPVAVPYDGATVATAAQCFIATATGIAGTRVAGDIFAIDCTNNRNF
jgi:prepilin-type N-terminal cleavage/methylation domain-containing protein